MKIDNIMRKYADAKARKEARRKEIQKLKADMVEIEFEKKMALSTGDKEKYRSLQEKVQDLELDLQIAEAKSVSEPIPDSMVDDAWDEFAKDHEECVAAPSESILLSLWQQTASDEQLVL